MNWGELAGLEASGRRIMGHNGFKEAAMVDDYTAKMTELIELMRLIGNDTQQCEVKECKRKISSTITDTLSAFSNGSGGWIILGLSEKNGFTPVEGFDARAMQEALSQACEKMTPVVRPVIVTCPFEGANLVFARIDEMLPRDKPCFTTALGPHGGSFIRTGDGDRRMTSYEVDRLIEEHLQPTYDLDIVPDATTDDLDPQLVAGLLARVREQHPRVFADRDGIDVLLDLQVLRHDDSDESEVGGILRPTLAGLLALGRYPQKFYPRLGISIAVFPGTSRDDVFRGDERLVASKSVVGSIPVMIDDAVDSLMRWIGAKKPDYPPLVLREAIANALTHRDYSPDARGTQVHISVFTDRIEITNPGGLYGMVTHDVLASPHPVTGAPFVSTRNQFLFTLLESTPYPGGGFVNPEGGDGYQRIAAALREAGIEPATTRNDINTFTMTITKQRTMANSSPGDVVKAIMTVLERHSAMSVKEIMRELQLTPLAATSGMRELMKEGRVARVKFADDPAQRPAARPMQMNITPNSATNPSEPDQPATLMPVSAAVPKPSALSIAVQYHQPGRNLAMVTITPGIMSIGNATPDVNMMSRPKMLANPLAASSESPNSLSMNPQATVISAYTQVAPNVISTPPTLRCNGSSPAAIIRPIDSTK